MATVQGKIAKYYFYMIVFFAIGYLISQLAKKKLEQHFTIILVIVLLLVLLTNPVLARVRHPIVIGVLAGVPALVLIITCGVILLK